MDDMDDPETKSQFDTMIRDEARRVVSGNSDVLAVILRGSYVTGTMTSTSDIDLYAVTKTSGPSSEFVQQDRVLFHIRYLPLPYLQFELRRMEPRYLGFVIHGRPVIDPSGIFTALQATVAALPARETLQRLPSEGRHQQEDARGQLEAGNPEAAICAAREAALAYMQAFLMANGIQCFKKRDVCNDLRKLQGYDDVRDLFMETMGLDAADHRLAAATLQRADALFTRLREHVRAIHGVDVIESPPQPW